LINVATPVTFVAGFAPVLGHVPSGEDTKGAVNMAEL